MNIFYLDIILQMMTGNLHVTKEMYKIKTIATEEEVNNPSIEWNDEYVMVTDRWIVGPSPFFMLKVGRSTDKKVTYVRPIEKHCDGVFEDLFDFGCECYGFTTDRVIKFTE